GRGACARSAEADLRSARGSNTPGCGLARPCAHAGGGAAAAGAGEAGAVSEGTVVADVAARVSAPAQAVLGATSVGARIFLRDGGRGGRENGDGVHRESKVGPRRPRVQGYRAHRALSRLSAGSASGGFSRKPT